MRAVGGDEVDQRFRVLDVLHEVGPARVGLDPGVAGLVVEIAPRRVQRRNAGIAAAREIEHGQIERQADEVVAQRLGDELVDLVADRAGHAAHDGAGRLFRRRAAGGICQRIEERRDQAQLLVVGRVQRVGSDRVEVRIEAIDRLGQHRVAEAIDRVRELRHDRRIEVDVIDLGRREERIDHAAGWCARTPRTRGAGTASRCRTSPPGTGARHSIEMQAVDEGAERCGSLTSSPPGASGARGRRQQPFIEEGQIVGLDARGNDRVHRLVDQPVVLGMEDVVDGGEADVLVHAAVAGDVVRVEQLVVVGGCPASATADPATLSVSATRLPAASRRHALCATSIRNWWPVRTALVRSIGASGLPSTRTSSSRCRRSRRAPFIMTIGEAVGPLDEVAVLVGREQRHVDTSASVKLMPRISRACALTTAHVAMPPISMSALAPCRRSGRRRPDPCW